MSAETKFSHGPWKIDSETVIDGVGGLFVYTGTMLYPTTIAVCNSSTKLTRLEMEANAHLIAAAPDLYEALAGMLHPSGGVYATEAVQERARAALAKARGES